jgi:YggT family protein
LASLTFVDAAGKALFWLAVVAASVCVIDWLVRTRRISPFNPIARFFRRTIDPLMSPVERRVVRAGGLPSNAPWWVLVVIILTGIILMQLLHFGFRFASQVGYAVREPSILPSMLASWTYRVLVIALLVRVVSSWLPISPTSKWIRWSFTLTEWMLGPIRRLLPTFGPVDISPLIAYLGLWLIRNIFGIP